MIQKVAFTDNAEIPPTRFLGFDLLLVGWLVYLFVCKSFK